jgi:GTP-binding protein
MAPVAEEFAQTGVTVSPAEQVRAIERELRKHDPQLLDKPRWLVLNKADLMFADEAAARAKAIVEELGWTGPWYVTSAISREGTFPIMKDVMAFFDRQREDALEAARNAG